MGGPGLGSRGRLALAACAAALLVPGAALAAFPGSNPNESPRLNTPNDPEFDRCEADDPDTPPLDCRTYFEEQYGLFGFRPDSAYSGVLGLPPTQYADCSQLDAQGRAANTAAGDPQCSMISGIRADTAWKRSTGDPDTVIAILDTGIRWQDRELVEQIHLNRAELPVPQKDRGAPIGGGPACAGFGAAYDANGDGAFNVRDYACDSRVEAAGGADESDAILDASDLIAAFSDGTDADQNGYTDDIAGWDFFDDDNDPNDVSSCCSANGHGTGRAKEAAARTNNAAAGAGICPRCQIMPLRIWDSFVVPTDLNAMGVVYAADNGASVVEVANGGLTNTRFSRRAYRYADERGVSLMSVSSDINSANHNYPTNYNEAVYVAGSLPDSAPFDTCEGLGGLPGIGSLPGPPDEFSAGCAELLGLLDGFLGVTGFPIAANLAPPTTSFFRNANLTQYGGKADIVLMGATGSENTGQASGAAGLLASYGRQVFGDDDPLTGNEIRQLLTMTAEDVLPANTGAIGLPDKAAAGWDPHFGYGRVNLAAATKRIADRRIPPEAQLDAPDWFAPVNVDRLPPDGLAVRGRAAAPHSAAGVGSWRLDYACGADAPDSSFQPVPAVGGGFIEGSGPVDGLLGRIPRSLLEGLADQCDGAVANDAGRPAGTLSEPWPANPYPEPDPERHSFQIRLTVAEQGDAQNIGRYRKTLFAYRDDGNAPGWPRPIGAGPGPGEHVTETGGEVSTRLFDLDGDNALDVVEASSSGELRVLGSDGEPLASFNGGQPVTTRPVAVAAAAGRVPPAVGEPPRETPRVPAIGDLDGDLEPDIVTAAGEHVYAWDRTGEPLAGFPVRIDPERSEPCKLGAPRPCFAPGDRAITSQNHIKRGIFGSPALADLDGDGALDVVVGAMDQHVYAWDGGGEPLPGWPVKVATAGAPGAEIITSPAIAQLDGEGPPEVVIATNEVVPGDPSFPTSLFELTSAFLGSATGSNPVYALHGDGTRVDGWPVMVGVAAGDLLPMVLPGHDAAALDSDGDGSDEVVVSAATSLGAGGTRLVGGDGETVQAFNSLAGNTLDTGPVLNLADYASVGALSGDQPSVVKGGLTLNGAANLLAPNQNLPFAHVVQAWDPETGAGLPAYPRATDDFQLVSQPAVANVGPGAGRQFLYGTGLYQLHAYGAGGLEPGGWPKFTGGWIQATPSVGDADGDGKLDVSVVTREGWSFLWRTATPACETGGETTNAEWWTFHHDEHGTANYGHDARPPGTVRGLAAGPLAADGSVTLSWTEPGDDWLCGGAERYRVLLGDGPVERAGDGREALAGDAAGPAGTANRVVLDEATLGDATHAAVLYRDDAGNWGLLRSVRLPERGGGPSAKRCQNRITGTAKADRLRGTRRGDRILGKGGDDLLRGRAGADCLVGGGGSDRHYGGRGDDVIRARGNARDLVHCGPGEDRAFVDRRDRVHRSCETVKRSPNKHRGPKR